MRTESLGDYGMAAAVSPAELNAHIAALPKGAAHLAPILAAVRDHHLGFMVMPWGARFRGLPDHALGRPSLFLIGDDLDTSRGPTAFDAKTLRRIFDGAVGVVIHAAEAEVAHYATATSLAVMTGGKAVVVETQPAHETAWLAIVTKHAPDAALLIITPEPTRYSREGGTA